MFAVIALHYAWKLITSKWFFESARFELSNALICNGLHVESDLFEDPERSLVIYMKKYPKSMPISARVWRIVPVIKLTSCCSIFSEFSENVTCLADLHSFAAGTAAFNVTLRPSGKIG